MLRASDGRGYNVWHNSSSMMKVYEYIPRVSTPIYSIGDMPFVYNHVNKYLSVITHLIHDS